MDQIDRFIQTASTLLSMGIPEDEVYEKMYVVAKTQGFSGGECFLAVMAAKLRMRELGVNPPLTDVSSIGGDIK